MHDEAQPKGGCLFGHAAVQTQPHGCDAATRETGVSQSRPSGKGARHGTCYVHTICRIVSLEPDISRPTATHRRSRALGRCSPLTRVGVRTHWSHHSWERPWLIMIRRVIGTCGNFLGDGSGRRLLWGLLLLHRANRTWCAAFRWLPARPLGLFQVPRVRRAPRDATPPVRGFVKGNRQTRPSKAPPFGRLTPTPRPLIDTAQLLGNLRELVAVVHGQSSVATLQPVRPGRASFDSAKGCSLHFAATLQSL
jgi:hypothetical protein